MPFKDLREFIAKLEKEGEVQRIEEEVDPNLEAGAMLRRSAERGLPAPFFQKVKGCPKGYRLIGNSVAKYRRIAIAMDMNPDTPPRELQEEYIRRKQKLIKPVFVKDAPCKENIHIGDEADLLEFPMPMIHAGDGGRYMGTWHITASRDLDNDWVNWGMYRLMLHDKTSFGIFALPNTHLGGVHATKYEPRDKVMEVAVVIGTEPVSTICAASPLAYGVSEVDLAGALRGEPVEMVKCETVNLAVPATAEIVIEGEIRPHERKDEGPFGEWTGYRAGIKQPQPVIHVKAITHRNNPIFIMSCMGVPTDDNTVSVCLTKGAEQLEALRARGLPVTGFSLPLETASFLGVAAVKTTYANIAEDVAHIVWGSRMGRSTPWIVVVNDDVDPFNTAQWLHALVSKCHPQRGVNIIENAAVSFLTPYINAHERQHGMGAKAYFDCTWPLDWPPSDIPKRMAFAEAYPAEVQQKASAMWAKYGY
ncbi:MAG: UbiD family decarboxylase [Chloroflexi bacterium]|nr:UbiD family decarboxylase [Chloroflexota bacterium]